MTDEKTTRRGSPGPISGGLWGRPLQDMGTRAATGGCVVGIDAEPGLHHQGAVWRAVLALIIRPLAAGLAVTGSFPGGSQVKRASDAEGLVGSQALDLPCLHATLAGARTLGRPQLSNQTSAVLQAPPAPQASSEEEELGGLSWSIMNPHAEGPTSPPSLGRGTS